MEFSIGLKVKLKICLENVKSKNLIDLIIAVVHIGFFAMVTQAEQHRRDIILHIASECRMSVTAGICPRLEMVPQALKGGSENGGEFWKIYSVHSIVVLACSYENNHRNRDYKP